MTGGDRTTTSLIHNGHCRGLLSSHWGYGAFFCVAACGAEITVVPPCDAPVAELAVIHSTIGHLQAFRGRRRLAVARACAAIASDLTGEDSSIQRALSQEDAAEVCARAKAAIEERLDGGADLAAAIIDFGGCYPFEEAAVTCATDCGTTDTCQTACDALAAFQAGCRDPTIVVESSDPQLAQTIEDHFAPILALDLFVSRHAGDAKDIFDPAADAVLNALGGQRCASERITLQASLDDADTAYDELLDLLTFVRISRLTVIE